MRFEKYDHITKYTHDTLHWLPVPQLVLYQHCDIQNNPQQGTRITYRTLQTGCMCLIRGVAWDQPPPETYSSREQLHRSFACAGPRAWNNLPPELRRIKRNDTFKKHLKTNLFKQSNGQWPSVPFRQCSLFCYISYAFVIIRWIALDSVALYTVISKLTSSIALNSRAKIHSIQISIGHLGGHLEKYSPVVIISTW